MRTSLRVPRNRFGVSKSAKSLLNGPDSALFPTSYGDGDPTADISPQILGGITPTQFRLLYKAPEGFISPTFKIFALSRLLKSSSF